MEMRQVPLSDAAVVPLLAGLTDEYDTRYGENVEMTRASKDEFDPPFGLFIVLMDGLVTAAGGGFRRYDPKTCEVKRMWTNPDYRRRGLAARVLSALEERGAPGGLRPFDSGDRTPPAGSRGALHGTRVRPD